MRDELSAGARAAADVEVLPPGISDVAAWRPGTPPADTNRLIVLGGIGRKP